MPSPVICDVPVTGQTPLYCNQTQPWATQHIDDKSIECYCLDAPEYIPTGGVRAVGRGRLSSGAVFAQAQFTSR